MMHFTTICMVIAQTRGLGDPVCRASKEWPHYGVDLSHSWGQKAGSVMHKFWDDFLGTRCPHLLVSVTRKWGHTFRAENKA